MNSVLSEVITLTSFGNQYLRTGILKEKEISHPFFQMCFNLDFRDKEELKEIVIAKNPLGWFEYLKKQGCLKMRLYHENKNKSKLPAHQLLAFAEFIPWLIEAVYPNCSDYWVNRNEIIYEDALGEKKWSANYGKIISKAPTTNLQLNPNRVREEFKNTLGEMATFAKRQNLDNWARKFEDAAYSLGNDDVARLYDALIVSDNYELINNQLMIAVGQADVFGGMGSWNDIGGFKNEKDYEEYNRLNEKLYQRINEAIISAINHDKLEVK